MRVKQHFLAGCDICLLYPTIVGIAEDPDRTGRATRRHGTLQETRNCAEDVFTREALAAKTIALTVIAWRTHSLALIPELCSS